MAKFKPALKYSLLPPSDDEHLDSEDASWGSLEWHVPLTAEALPIQDWTHPPLENTQLNELREADRIGRDADIQAGGPALTIAEAAELWRTAGFDIHRDTAAKIFGVSPEEVTDEMRREAKVVNNGLTYGSSKSNVMKHLRQAAITGGWRREYGGSNIQRLARELGKVMDAEGLTALHVEDIVAVERGETDSPTAQILAGLTRAFTGDKS